MAGAHSNFRRGRIYEEIRRWVTTVHNAHLPATNMLSVDFPGTNRDQYLLRLAVAARTNVPLSVRIFGANCTIDAGNFDLSRLRGSLRLYPSSGLSSLSYASIGEMIYETSHLRRLTVDCPIAVPNGIDAAAVADMIHDVKYASTGMFTFEFTLPPIILVEDVSDELVNNNAFEDWHYEGAYAVRSSDFYEDRTEMRINVNINRVSVTVSSPAFLPP